MDDYHSLSHTCLECEYSVESIPNSYRSVQPGWLGKIRPGMDQASLAQIVFDQNWRLVVEHTHSRLGRLISDEQMPL